MKRSICETHIVQRLQHSSRTRHYCNCPNQVYVTFLSFDSKIRFTLLTFRYCVLIAIQPHHHTDAVTYTCTSCKTPRRIPAPPTLTPNTSSPSSDQPPASNPTAATPATADVMHIDIHPTPKSQPPPKLNVDSQQKNRRKKKEPPVPRPLPFFARSDVGHVVFRGNEILNPGEI